MNDRTRTALAFLLIIAVLFLWSFLNKPKTTQTPLAPTTKDSLQKPTAISAPEIIISPGDTIVIDKEKIRVVLSSNGGSVKSFYLKPYNVDIVPKGNYLFVSKIGETQNDIINFDYIVSHDSVIFIHKIANKNLRKIYYFNNENGFCLTTHFPGAIRQTLSLKSGLNVTELKNRGEDLRFFNVYIKDEKVNNITKKIKDSFEYSGKIDWFAMRNKYFLLVVNNLESIEQLKFYKIPKDIDETGKKTTHNIKDFSGDEVNLAFFGCPYYMQGGGSARYGAEIIGTDEIEISVLLLPMKYSSLAKFKKNYEEIAGGGLWGPIARVIILIFNFFFSVIKNYGFAIVIFAILVKAVFFPLSKQMILSQHKMQMLQPELQKIQKRYKDDPTKINKEMMHLYKTYKVNPFSGCLPLIIQMPIFFALYETLSTSIEFRQAPFILWITDLSFKDPYYVLPIGMGVMMLIQSLFTTIDPRQRFMIITMPIFMVLIFLNMPSGLQLYWFAYNVLTLVENYITKRGGIK